MELNEKNYVFDGIANGVSVYTERSGGLVAAYSPLTAQVSLGKGARGSRNASRSRSVWKLSVPHVAGTDTSCACIGDVLSQEDVTIDVRLDANSASAAATDIVGRIRDLVNSPQFEASVVQHVQPNS